MSLKVAEGFVNYIALTGYYRSNYMYIYFCVYSIRFIIYRIYVPKLFFVFRLWTEKIYIFPIKLILIQIFNQYHQLYHMHVPIQL